MEATAKPIRIAFVSHKFQLNDGQGRVNYEVVRAALDQGYEVTVLATSCATEIASHPNARFIPTGKAWLPTALLRNLVFAGTSARWLRRHRKEVDLTQANGFVTWEDCDIAAAHFVHTSWKASRSYPFTSWAPYDLYQRMFTKLNSKWEKRVFLNAKRVIAVSSRIERELEDLGVPPSHIDVIYNGVDTDQFFPGEGERSSFGLPVDVPLALFVGDIRTPRKNLESVLRALQRLPSLFLAVAGGTQGSPYLALARDLGVSDRVIFLGKVSRIGPLMRSVDLFVFPSRYDPFGLVVLEAMASGVPVIASASSGIADHIGRSGELLHNPDDVEELIRLVSGILADSSIRLRMGQTGRRLALEMQWTRMAAEYLEVYKKLFEKTTEVTQGASSKVDRSMRHQ